VTLHYAADGTLVQLDLRDEDTPRRRARVRHEIAAGMLFLSLRNAAERLGAHPATLRRAAKEGDLRALRVSREWVTTAAWLDEYQRQRRPRGRPRRTA
jgi:excisionase family DNA binding protein